MKSFFIIVFIYNHCIICENLPYNIKHLTDQLKKHIKKIITANNTEIRSIKLQKITGDYKPRYIYSKIKTHKQSNPIKPIISRIPTPVHHNNMIVPYISNKFDIKSTHEFMQILNSNTPNKCIMASHNVKNLFTYFLVPEAIKIIIENVYNHPSIPPLAIQSKILLTFTTKVPFYDLSGKLYIQIDDISME